MAQRVPGSRRNPCGAHFGSPPPCVTGSCPGNRVDHSLAIIGAARLRRNLMAHTYEKRAEGRRRPSALSDLQSNVVPLDLSYWTVMVPFMFIARCGVQKNGYAPGLTFAKEIV